MEKIRYSLVAYIFPETDWVGNIIGDLDIPKIANKDQSGEKGYGIAFCEVWHPRDNPDGWMVYNENPFFPGGIGTEPKDFQGFRDAMDHALSLPVMHCDDFSYIFEE